MAIILKNSEIAKYKWKAEDVARVLGYHIQYVRTLAHNNILPAIKRRREWMFSEEEILNWLKSTTKEAKRHARKK